MSDMLTKAIFYLLIVIGINLALRNVSMRRRIIGFVLISIAISWLIAGYSYRSKLNVNPTIHNKDLIEGNWLGEDETLELLPESAIYRKGIEISSWHWELDGCTLVLKTSVYIKKMRFIVFDGKYRLIQIPEEGLDSWDGNLGLYREK